MNREIKIQLRNFNWTTIFWHHQKHIRKINNGQEKIILSNRPIQQLTRKFFKNKPKKECIEVDQNLFNCTSFRELLLTSSCAIEQHKTH